jgi:hypothetical protein
MNAVKVQNAIVFAPAEILINLLDAIPTAECNDYMLITLDEWTRIYNAFIVRKERVDLLESMNVIVAQRMSFVDDNIQSFQLEDECKKHIFPVYTPDPKFSSLQLNKLMGLFVLLFLLLFTSLLVLVGEVLCEKFQKKENIFEEIVEPFEIHLQVGNVITPEIRRQIQVKYFEILQLIDKNENLH